jgi:hypothetical protein
VYNDVRGTGIIPGKHLIFTSLLSRLEERR